MLSPSFLEWPIRENVGAGESRFLCQDEIVFFRATRYSIQHGHTSISLYCPRSNAMCHVARRAFAMNSIPSMLPNVPVVFCCSQVSGHMEALSLGEAGH